MKPLYLVPPVLALAIAAFGVGGQRKTITTLETQNTLLRKEITTARVAADLAATARSSEAAAKKKPEDSIDWKKIATDLEGMQSSRGMTNMRAFMRLQQRILSMDKEELQAALDEIAALDIPSNTRAMIEQFIIGGIAEKDPELALTQFIDRVHDRHGSVSWQLTNALTTWAKKDLAAASAWFDAEIAKGTFDSKSLDGKQGPRQRFEGALLNVLITEDSAAAGRRLEALTPDEQREALGQFSMHRLGEDGQKAFAELVRSKLPEDQQADVIANRANSLIHSGGYSEVSGYLDRIDASPAERDATVDRVADAQLQILSHQRKITRDDIEELRDWSETEAPGSAGRATGKALAGAMNSGNGMKFAEASKLAESYHEAGGGDEVLVPLLEHWRTNENKEQARELAQKIADDKTRERILERLK